MDYQPRPLAALACEQDLSHEQHPDQPPQEIAVVEHDPHAPNRSFIIFSDTSPYRLDNAPCELAKQRSATEDNSQLALTSKTDKLPVNMNGTLPHVSTTSSSVSNPASLMAVSYQPLTEDLALLLIIAKNPSQQSRNGRARRMEGIYRAYYNRRQ